MSLSKLALSKFKDKLEDVYTCSVCSSSYNHTNHKPKILTCSHTFCLTCIKAINKGPSIMCPFCRKETKITTKVVNGELRGIVNELPNNPHVLSALDALALLYLSSKTSPRWCLECGKVATKFCKKMPAHTHHYTILIDSASSKECLELQEMWSANKHKQDSVIQKRKEANFFLQQLSIVLTDGIKKKCDESDARLNFISDLKAGLNVSPEDTVQSLRLKVVESSEVTSEELDDVQQLKENYLHLKTAAAIFQSNMKIPKMISDEDFNQIPLDRYFFHLEFTRGSRNLGSIQIKPHQAFFRPFMIRFGRLCHQSPMVFSSSIMRSITGAFATVGFYNRDFKQDVPDPSSFPNYASNRKVDTKLDVGFADSSYDGNSMIGFQLMFLIQDRVKNFPLFGVITEGSDVVDVLSRTPPLERGAFEVSMQFLQHDD